MFTLDGTINSSVTANVFEDGGYVIYIPGSYEDGASYSIHIGDYRNALDPVCYSGIPEQGSSIYPQLNGVLYAYTPLLQITGVNPYSVTVINESTLSVQTLIDVLFVRKKQFYNKVYRIRKVLPPRYKTGPRSILEENRV